MSDRLPDFEVLHGSPSAEDLAALVIALTPVAVSVADEAVAAGPAAPAWAQAALLQGVGGIAPRTPADLRRPSA